MFFLLGWSPNLGTPLKAPVVSGKTWVSGGPVGLVTGFSHFVFSEAKTNQSQRSWLKRVGSTGVGLVPILLFEEDLHEAHRWTVFPAPLEPHRDLSFDPSNPVSGGSISDPM